MPSSYFDSSFNTNFLATERRLGIKKNPFCPFDSTSLRNSGVQISFHKRHLNREEEIWIIKVFMRHVTAICLQWVCYHKCSRHSHWKSKYFKRKDCCSSLQRRRGGIFATGLKIPSSQNWLKISIFFFCRHETFCNNRTEMYCCKKCTNQIEKWYRELYFY